MVLKAGMNPITPNLVCADFIGALGSIIVPDSG